MKDENNLRGATIDDTEEWIIKKLSIIEKKLHCKHKDEEPCNSCRDRISGNTSKISGDMTNIWGDVSGITGDVSNLSGDVSEIYSHTEDIIKILKRNKV